MSHYLALGMWLRTFGIWIQTKKLDVFVARRVLFLSVALDQQHPSDTLELTDTEQFHSDEVVTFKEK